MILKFFSLLSQPLKNTRNRLEEVGYTPLKSLLLSLTSLPAYDMIKNQDPLPP
jgi:hypothetical protein